jgi:hypothetical protein
MRVSQNAAQSEFCSSLIHHNKTLYDKGYSPGIPGTIYRKVNEENSYEPTPFTTAIMSTRGRGGKFMKPKRGGK